MAVAFPNFNTGLFKNLTLFVAPNASDLFSSLCTECRIGSPKSASSKTKHRDDPLSKRKLLKQGYGYHKLRETFSKFYRRYYDLISKFQVGLKFLLHQGLWEPEFYGNLVNKLKKIVGSNNFFSTVHYNNFPL